MYCYEHTRLVKCSSQQHPGVFLDTSLDVADKKGQRESGKVLKTRVYPGFTFNIVVCTAHHVSAGIAINATASTGSLKIHPSPPADHSRNALTTVTAGNLSEIREHCKCMVGSHTFCGAHRGVPLAVPFNYISARICLPLNQWSTLGTVHNDSCTTLARRWSGLPAAHMAHLKVDMWLGK